MPVATQPVAAQGPPEIHRTFSLTREPRQRHVDKDSKEWVFCPLGIVLVVVERRRGAGSEIVRLLT